MPKRSLFKKLAQSVVSAFSPKASSSSASFSGQHLQALEEPPPPRKGLAKKRRRNDEEVDVQELIKPDRRLEEAANKFMETAEGEEEDEEVDVEQFEEAPILMAQKPTSTAQLELLEANSSSVLFDESAFPEIPGKNRREKEKNGFNALAQQLPLSPPIRDQVDKTGTLRITIAFIQLHQLISGLMGRGENPPSPLTLELEGRTTGENGGARKFQREWAQKRHSTVEPLRQFAFNIFQAMDGFVIVLNHKGHVLYVNETVAVHLGLSQVELIGNFLGDFLHAQDVQLLSDKLAIGVDQRVLRVIAPDLHFVLRFRCAPGRKAMMTADTSHGIRGMPGFKAIHFTGTLWPNNDGRFIGFGQPLVPYGQNEIRLTRSMFMFRATLALQMIFVDNCFVSCTGFPANSLLDNSFYSFCHPADVGELAEAHQTALDQGQSQSGLFRMICARGGHFWLQCRFCLINVNRLSCCPSIGNNNRVTNVPQQIIIVICSVVSEVENEELAMDSLQMEWRDSKLRGGEADGIEEQQKYQHENGLLGHYSSKFYGSSQCVGGANEG